MKIFSGFNIVAPARKSCVHFVYKNCTRCIQLMYTKCIQDAYEMYPTFRQTFVYILYTKLKELWQLKFVNKMYTKVCRHVVYILHIPCIQFLYISSDLQKGYIIRTMYTICIQNTYKIYTNNCM